MMGAIQDGHAEGYGHLGQEGDIVNQKNSGTGIDNGKPYRLNSQQSKRPVGIDGKQSAVEGYGRPLTKHQARARVSNSQGGARRRV